MNKLVARPSDSAARGEVPGGLPAFEAAISLEAYELLRRHGAVDGDA